MTAIAGDLVPSKGIDGGILFTVVPIAMIFINSLGVRVSRPRIIKLPRD